MICFRNSKPHTFDYHLWISRCWNISAYSLANHLSEVNLSYFWPWCCVQDSTFINDLPHSLLSISISIPLTNCSVAKDTTWNWSWKPLSVSVFCQLVPVTKMRKFWVWPSRLMKTYRRWIDPSPGLLYQQAQLTLTKLEVSISKTSCVQSKSTFVPSWSKNCVKDKEIKCGLWVHRVECLPCMQQIQVWWWFES